MNSLSKTPLSLSVQSKGVLPLSKLNLYLRLFLEDVVVILLTKKSLKFVEHEVLAVCSHKSLIGSYQCSYFQ